MKQVLAWWISLKGQTEDYSYAAHESSQPVIITEAIKNYQFDAKKINNKQLSIKKSKMIWDTI